MTIDEVVWLICMSKEVKPVMIPWRNIREAGGNRAEAVGVEGVVCVTLESAWTSQRTGCVMRWPLLLVLGWP